MSINYEDDVTKPDTSALVPLSEQLETARRLEADAEAEYKDRKRATAEIERLIGEKLVELGIVGAGSKIKLDNGKTLTLDEQTYVSIPATLRDKAYGWLKANGYGKLIVTETRESVNVGRLRPMADDLPRDLFKVSPVRKVKIK